MGDQDVLRKANKIVHYEHARLARMANMHEQEEKAKDYERRWTITALVSCLFVAMLGLASTPQGQSLPSWYWWLASGAAYITCRSIGRIVYLRRSPW